MVVGSLVVKLLGASGGVIATLAIFAGLAPAAEAAFPGTNGKLAFSSTRAITGLCDPCQPHVYTMSADGTGVTRLDPAGGNVPEHAPEWSPAGTQIAYDRATVVTKINADGSGRTSLVDGREPTWSPDGAKLAFEAGAIYTVNADGTGQVVAAGGSGCVASGGGYVCTSYSDPSWSPAGEPLVRADHTTHLSQIRPPVVTGRGSQIKGGSTSIGSAEDPDWSPNADRIVFAVHIDVGNGPVPAPVGVANPDGSGATALTGNICPSDPAWSPDASRIAFAAGGAACGGDREIYVMNADGSNLTQLTDNTYDDSAPSWQPIPVNTYVRPKFAGQIRTPLVPAFRACEAAEATHVHGPPLAHPSCGPSTQVSSALTVGTPDANGNAANSVGQVRIRQAGDDITLDVSLSDVRRASDGSDYGGELRFEIVAQITDRDNTPTPAAFGAATMQGTPLSAATPCTATTAGTIGASCATSTSVEALVPGAVQAGKRAVWELGSVRILDGGTDGDADTEPNELFATQGLFVP